MSANICRKLCSTETQHDKQKRQDIAFYHANAHFFRKVLSHIGTQIYEDQGAYVCATGSVTSCSKLCILRQIFCIFMDIFAERSSQMFTNSAQLLLYLQAEATPYKIKLKWNVLFIIACPPTSRLKASDNVTTSFNMTHFYSLPQFILVYCRHKSQDLGFESRPLGWKSPFLTIRLLGTECCKLTGTKG